MDVKLNHIRIFRKFATCFMKECLSFRLREEHLIYIFTLKKKIFDQPRLLRWNTG